MTDAASKHPRPRELSITDFANRSRAGDQESLEQLMKLMLGKHAQRLKKRIDFLRYYGVKPSDMDDITQEMLVKLMDMMKRRTFDVVPNRDVFFKKLGGIAYNVMREARRKSSAAKRTAREEEADESLEAADSEEEQTRQLQELFDELRSKLKERGVPAEGQEQIWDYLLLKIQGYSRHEIESKLHLRKTDVKIIRSRIKELRSILEIE